MLLSNSVANNIKCIYSFLLEPHKTFICFPYIYPIGVACSFYCQDHQEE